ncbi:MAG TPA: nucleotide disphospho-sugar-binding domain-containing protein [Candidatus Limnocylindria bacterium]|nr:nucleotide disphospho-sugar-binding domain-containing protein [Candidatus Limnocylindria bacterium]
MTRIALATVGTTGDVAPFAILARELARRGHDVTAVTWPVHRSLLSQAGVRVEVAGPQADASRIASVAADAATRGPMDQVAVLRDFHLADGEAHYRRLVELLAGHDIVVLHAIHALAHAAVLDLEVRWATAVFDPVLLPTATAPPPGMPNLGPFNRLAWSMLDRMLARTGKPLDELLSRAGSRQRGVPLFRSRSPLLHMVACSPSIIHVPGDLPPTTRITGAWLDRTTPATLPAELETFLDDGAPPVVVAFGSMSGSADDAVGAAIESILQAGRRVVVQGSAAGGLSSPNLARIGKVDHRALFPRAAAVIHHGGAGTTHAACAAGVPSVVVSHVGDQRYWADRLHHLGVAPAELQARSLDAAKLADAALATASDPSMHDAARALAEVIAREDGVAVATAAIEALHH